MALDIAYGYRVTSMGDELVETAERANMGTVLAESPGSVLVDFFPSRALFSYVSTYHC